MEDFNSKYSGEQVEELLDMVANGEAGGGGGGIAVETDPIFSASPAATITEDDISGWRNLGNDFSLLDGDVAELTDKVEDKQDIISDLETIREGASKGATAVQPEDIKDEVYIADFTMESLRDGIYNGTNVDCNVRALVDAMTANKIILVREVEDSSYKGVYILNGYAEDLLYFSIVDTSGNILWCDGTDYIFLQGIDAQSLHERSWGSKQDTLVSGENIKTINGESVVGSGNIEISGGSGEVGPQGPQGEQGPKGEDGEDGVGIASVKQTTTSSADGGSNVVTVTLTNGTTSTFTVKNGSKGSSGTNGTNGKDGADGATFTPSVDSAGNLSWTNNKGLTNPPTVNIKGPKGDKGDAGEGGGSTGGGKEVIVNDNMSVYINDALPNRVYILTNVFLGDLEITSFLEETDYDEYTFIFRYPEMSFAFPSDVVFANETIPTVGANTLCELSIVGITIRGKRRYNAVLTTFGYL